jgi:hypothetical protein
MSASVWVIYTSMRALCVPRAASHHSAHSAVDETVSRANRLVLSGTGLVRRHKEGLDATSSRMRDFAVDEMRDQSTVLWFDNHNKARFSRNPNEDKDKTINCTVFASLVIPCPVPFPGYPTLKTLVDGVDGLIATLLAETTASAHAVDVLFGEGLQHSDVRAPLDIRRLLVSSAQWRPLEILHANVGSTSGLVDSLVHARAYLQHASGVTLMVDINIYYRILKLMYSRSYYHVDFRSYMSGLPLCLGVWHSYKYCVASFFTAFLPFVTALEYGPKYMADPSGQSVTNGPKTILMERVVLGIFLAANSVRVELTAARAAATGHVKMNLDALWYCVFEYVPMLFYLGRMVRDCNWKSVETCPGTHARRLNQLCLVFLLHVRDTVSARREEYISGLMLQNLLWSPLHGSIPGAAHCEENLEAMIGRLSRELRSDLTCDSVEAASKVFAKMGATSDTLKDLVKANFPKEFPRRVSLRLTGLISAIQTDTVPFISYGQPKT